MLKELQKNRLSYLRAKYFQFCVHSVQTTSKGVVEHKGFLTFVELPSSNKTTTPPNNPQVNAMKVEVESANQLIMNFGELINSILIKDPENHADSTRLNAKLVPFLTPGSKLFIFFNLSPLLQDFGSTFSTLKFASLLQNKSVSHESQSRPPSRVPAPNDYNNYPPHQQYDNPQTYNDRQGQGYMQQDQRNYQQQRRPQNLPPQTQQPYQRGQHFQGGYQERHQRPMAESRDFFQGPGQNNPAQGFRGETHSGSASAQKKNPNQGGYSASRRSANVNSDSFDGMMMEDIPDQPSVEGANLKFPGESTEMKKNSQEDNFNRNFDSNKMNLETIEPNNMSPGQYNRGSMPDRNANPNIPQPMNYQQRFSQESSGQQSRQQFSQYNQTQPTAFRDNPQGNQQQPSQGYASQQSGQGYMQGSQGYQNRRNDSQGSYNKFGGRPQAAQQGSQYRQPSQMGGQSQGGRPNYQTQYDSQRGGGYGQQSMGQGSFSGKPPGQYQSNAQPQRNRSQGPGSNMSFGGRPGGPQQSGLGQEGFQATAPQEHQFEGGQQRNQSQQGMGYFNNNIYPSSIESPTNQGRMQSVPKSQGFSNEKPQTNPEAPSPHVQLPPHQIQNLGGNQHSQPHMAANKGAPQQHPAPQRPEQGYFNKQNQMQQSYGGGAGGYPSGSQRSGSYDNYGGGQNFAGGQPQGGYGNRMMQNSGAQAGGNRYQNNSNYTQKPQHGYGNQRQFNPNK